MTIAHDTIVDFEDARAFKRRRLLRIGLPVGVVALILAAMIAIALYDYRAMRRDVLALSDDVTSNLQSRIETEVASYLSPIPGIVEFTREMLADQALLSVRRELAEKISIGILRHTPQLTSVFVGTVTGEYFMVRRFQHEPQPGVETKIIRRPGGAIGRTGQAMIVDDQGRVIAHPTWAAVTEGAGDGLRLPYIGGIGDPVLRRAFDRYRVEGHGRRDFEQLPVMPLRFMDALALARPAAEKKGESTLARLFRLIETAAAEHGLLESEDRVVGVTHHGHCSAGLARAPLLRPKIENIAQLDIRQQGRNRPTLRRACRPCGNDPVIQYAGLLL